MKKSLLLIVILLGISLNVSAQSSQIVCTAYKQIYRFSGTWGEWPNHWTTFASEGKPNPVIRITTLREGYYYRIQMFIDGNVTADVYVRYNAELSAQKRRDWNNQYVNCYKDVNGDSVYTQTVSLKSLASDPRTWARDEDATLYIWAFSEDMAIVVR